MNPLLNLKSVMFDNILNELGKNNIKISEDEFIFMTLIDRTLQEKLKMDLENTKLSIGIIFIDNYEETMKRFIINKNN